MKETVPGRDKPKGPYRAGQIVDPGSFDPALLPTGYMLENGRVTRLRKSNRPESCLPEVWAMLSPKQKEKYIQKEKDAKAKAASGAGPSTAVVQPARKGPPTVKMSTLSRKPSPPCP